MINYLAIKIFLVFVLCLYVTAPLASSSKNFNYKKKEAAVESRWTGRIVMEEIINIPGPFITAVSKRTIHASFVNALPTLYRNDESADLSFTDDKGSGSHTFHSEGTIGKQNCVTDCSSSGKAELHAIVINEVGNTYDIEVISPKCVGTTCGDDNTVQPYDEVVSVIVTDRQLINKDELGGTKIETGELPGGTGTFTRTITWHFTRTTEPDVELIVIPENYDRWLPRPGKNERTESDSTLKISLKLQGRNGVPTSKKAKSFELKLINTSTEPGMTINFPVNSSNTSPDLKFLYKAPTSVIVDTLAQSLKIICNPSKQTGECKIGSYDGGGWTILNAEAILDDSTRVQGRLLFSNGEVDIRIPKRDPNSHIAEAWLKTNGNPVETDDKDTSKGNGNNGDGFTAYEEYRGVIANSNFKRLDPNRKEIGVQITKTDLTLFARGIGWFEIAGSIDIVIFDFDKDEIGPDGRLNMNIKTSHDYDQYALFVLNGGLGGNLGRVYSKRNHPDIPAQIISVVADWNQIQSAYQRRVNGTRPEVLQFSLSDYLAQTVAHELGHAVNVWHHGVNNSYDSFIVRRTSDRIFDRNGNLITVRPMTLYSIGDSINTLESGDLTCMLNYYPYYSWGYTNGADGVNIFNEEPLIPLGRLFCKSKNATGFNATRLFFGNGEKGNCLGQIKLRN
jgi:hypothetical protein